MNWIHDPAPPTSRRPNLESAGTPAPAIAKEFPGALSTQPRQKKSRRRRRRKASRTANQNTARRSAAPVTPDERWANRNSASQRATRPKSAANDPQEMRSTTVNSPPSFHSSHVSQPPIPAANENAGFPFDLDRCEFSGLYKPAQIDPRQDLTATPTEIKYLRERANARLSTMKYMTSLKEGASYRVQHAYYLACTRTLIDYAAPTLTNMTQTQKASLEVIQNNAMRLMLGAPMWTRQCNLRAETNLPSLEHRIEQRNITITAKMLGSERDSQTQRRMRDELPKNPDIQRPNTHSKYLGNIVRKCKMKNILLDIKQATHTVNPIPPWENDLANYNYTQLDKPKEQCTLQELKTAAELSISLSENLNCSVYYTDGSVDPTTNTAGAAVYSDTYTASWRTSDTSSTLQTELVAIHKTLQYSINHGHTNVTIHTDSKSALLTLQRTKQKENTHLIYNIKTLLLQHKTAGRKVTLNWIPSHIGIPGNDKADELAGTTKHIDRVQITMPLSILTIKNTLKQTNRTNIEKEVTHWANNNSRSAQWYTKATKFEPPPIYRDTPRHLAVTIHRLRLGYKANWEIDEPIIRPCEHCQTQTGYPLLHYLLQCPNTQSLRPHMQALDPANPEANQIAAGLVKDIMDNIETHIQTLTDFPPPR